MADNTQLNPGNGGDLIKTEDLGACKVAVSKIYLGARGVDGGPVTPANPLPVSVGNFPATQAVTVGNFPATQAVSASALPLPSGAATAAKQPAPGAAGTASADVLSVQGIAGMTPLKVDGSGATQPVSGTVAVSNFPATQAVSGSVAITGTVATSANLSVAGAAVAANNPVPVSQATPLPAGTNTIGAVIAQAATGVLYNGTTGLTPKFAPIAATTAGDNTLVAAVAGKKLRVVKYTIITAGAVATKFRTASGTDLTGAMALAANSGVGGAYCPVGLFETAVGDALVLNLSAAASVAGHLTYVEV